MEAAGAPIVIIFGSGPNIGASTIETFRQHGYRVAFSSRSAQVKDSNSTTLALKCDLSVPDEVMKVFNEVRSTWGEPDVVVYNACAYHLTEPIESFNISTDIFEQQLRINTTGAFVAIREAIASFSKTSYPKTFLFTGNMSNEGPVPGWLTLGIGKNASAFMVRMADSIYKHLDVRFHWVDERTPEGKPMFTDLGGQAHADMFLELAERKLEPPLQVTFVKEKGYTEFPHELIL